MGSVADDFSFRSAWRLGDERIVEDVKRFWSQANLPALRIEGRENEICAVAYNGEELVAVSTASLFYDPSMRNNMFGYRCMVAPHLRQQNLAWRISAFSLKILEEWNALHPEVRALGLMISVETDKFETGLRKPVREKFGFTMNFVGYSATGQQLRVVWFENAKLDDQTARQA